MELLIDFAFYFVWFTAVLTPILLTANAIVFVLDRSRRAQALLNQFLGV